MIIPNLKCQKRWYFDLSVDFKIFDVDRLSGIS